MTDRNDIDHRPSPESLLSRIETEEKKAQRGRLKIFFGSCAGVGKTYAMLSAARDLYKQGQDIVVGFVETHQRPQTLALLDGMPQLPTRKVHYHGVVIDEFDLDAALDRKPHTLLVDELAHTNAPGARHPKRWHDVIELLDAGIHVFTTLNVQHIESLSDIVAGTTGIWVKETIPDSVFDMAEDIVLVDIDPDDLLKRLHEGNVYVAPGANHRAAENFFRKGNLNSLRELSLRRTAERVDADSIQEVHDPDRVAITENLLVCVDAAPLSAKLIRSTKRLSIGLKAKWTALHVETPDDTSSVDGDKRQFMEILERMVDRLGGTMLSLEGDDVLDEILAFAKENHVTKIIVGRDVTENKTGFFRKNLLHDLLARSGSIDIIVITDDRESKREGIQATNLHTFRILNYIVAFITLIAFTVPSQALPDVVTATDQALLYVAGIVLVADHLGLGASLFYAVLAGLLLGLFFVHPTASLNDNISYLFTLFVMVITAYTVARNATRLKRQAVSAREKEKRTRVLYDITRRLSTVNGRFTVSRIVSDELSKSYPVKATIWMTNTLGHLSVVLGDLPEDTYYKDFGALEWCLENAQNAGKGTSTMPSAQGLYLPLTSANGTLGVIGLYPTEASTPFTHDQISSIETLASLLASALERVKADEIAQQAIVEQENRKLRESLSKASFEMSGSSISPEIPKFGQDVEKSLRLSHLESPDTQVNRFPTSLPHIIQSALNDREDLTATNEYLMDIAPDLPDVMVDPSMIQQLFANIIENAVKYAPPYSKITIRAQREGHEITVSIEDEGPGLPAGSENKIFNKFFSIPHSGQDKSGGLGLTISAGIVRLHEGRIWADNRPEGGARILFTLPIA